MIVSAIFRKPGKRKVSRITGSDNQPAQPIPRLELLRRGPCRGDSAADEIPHSFTGLVNAGNPNEIAMLELAQLVIEPALRLS